LYWEILWPFWNAIELIISLQLHAMVIGIYGIYNIVVPSFNISLQGHGKIQMYCIWSRQYAAAIVQHTQYIHQYQIHLFNFLPIIILERALITDEGVPVVIFSNAGTIRTIQSFYLIVYSS
jgi:hypothetical protein